VQLVRGQADGKAAARQLVSGMNVHLTCEDVAQVIVDGRIVLHVEFGRQPQPSPVFAQLGTAVGDVCSQDERVFTVNRYARSKVGQRLLVVHPEHRDRSVVHRIAWRRVEYRPKQRPDGMPDKRP
jgi:hypothetical protein